MSTYQCFWGFTYKDKHSSDFGINHVSTDSHYNESFSGVINDSFTSVVGRDGVYYNSTTIGQMEIKIDCGFIGADVSTLKKIKEWLYPRGFGELIFDESPYKKYIAKVTEQIQFKNMPLSNSSILNTFTNNGFFSISMLVIDPFAYSTVFSLTDYTSKGDFENIWYYDSGILLTDQTPVLVHNTVTAQKDFLLYNAGNSIVYPEITIVGTGSAINILSEISTDTYSGIIIDYLDNQTLVYDSLKKQATIGTSPVNYKLTDSDPLYLLPSVYIERHDDVTFTDGANKILTLASGIWDADIVGKHVCINNVWYRVSTRISATIIYIETSSGLVDDTEYDDVVVAKLTRCRITGSDYAYTSEVDAFNKTVANVLDDSYIENPIIKGVTGSSGGGVLTFTLSTANTPATVYTPDGSVSFPLYNLPNGIYDEINDLSYVSRIEKKTFNFTFANLVFGSKLTTFNGQSLTNVALYPATAYNTSVDLYIAGAPNNSYKTHFKLYNNTTLMEQVDVDEIDLTASIGKYYYEYDIISGVPTCTVYVITATGASAPTNIKPLFDVDIDTETFSFVDVVKLGKTWYTNQPYTSTVGKDGLSRVWNNATELTEVSYLEIDSSSNAGATYYINSDDTVWLIVTKGSVTESNIRTVFANNFTFIYQRYLNVSATFSNKMSEVLKYTDNTDYITIDTLGETPEIEFDIDMTPKSFSVNVTYDYDHKYI